MYGAKEALLHRRSGFDRRIGEDRRQSYCLDFIENNESERRAQQERRISGEMRKGWVRCDNGLSVTTHTEH